MGGIWKGYTNDPVNIPPISAGTHRKTERGLNIANHPTKGRKRTEGGLKAIKIKQIKLYNPPVEN